MKLLRVLETGTFTRVGIPPPAPTCACLPPPTATRRRRSPTASCARPLPPAQRIPDRDAAAARARHRHRAPRGALPRRPQQAGGRVEESSRPRPSPRSTPGWPGNVRELKNYVQRAFILADDVIDANLAPAAVAAPESAPLLSVRVGTARRGEPEAHRGDPRRVRLQAQGGRHARHQPENAVQPARGVQEQFASRSGTRRGIDIAESVLRIHLPEDAWPRPQHPRPGAEVIQRVAETRPSTRRALRRARRGVARDERQLGRRRARLRARAPDRGARMAAAAGYVLSVLMRT